MNRLVIDTDPGVDDAHAIMVAFAHPEAQVEAITTVAGCASLEQTTANACTTLDVLERDVPVFAGCGRAPVAKDTSRLVRYNGPGTERGPGSGGGRGTGVGTDAGGGQVKARGRIS